MFTKAVHKGPEGNFLSSDYDGKRDHLLASPLLGTSLQEPDVNVDLQVLSNYLKSPHGCYGAPF